MHKSKRHETLPRRFSSFRRRLRAGLSLLGALQGVSGGSGVEGDDVRELGARELGVDSEAHELAFAVA